MSVLGIDLWTLVIVLVVFAFAVGFLGALAGLGGGEIINPVLYLVFGVPFGFSTGASSVSVMGTSTAASAEYVRARVPDIRVASLLQAVKVPGAIGGAALTVYLVRLGWTPVLLIVLGLVLGLTVPLYVIARHEEDPRPETSGKPDRITQELGLKGNYFDQSRKKVLPYRAKHSAWTMLVMIPSGLVTGLFGIGGGVLNILGMDRIMGLPMKVSSATSNFMNGLAVMSSAGVLFAGGLVIPQLAAPLAIGCVTGAYTGSRFFPRFHNQQIRWVFIALLMVFSVWTLYKGVVTL